MSPKFKDVTLPNAENKDFKFRIGALSPVDGAFVAMLTTEGGITDPDNFATVRAICLEACQLYIENKAGGDPIPVPIFQKPAKWLRPEVQEGEIRLTFLLYMAAHRFNLEPFFGKPKNPAVDSSAVATTDPQPNSQTV